MYNQGAGLYARTQRCGTPGLRLKAACLGDLRTPHKLEYGLTFRLPTFAIPNPPD
jgi:hypothetical protein